jgi:hypothetical protein
MIRKRERMRFTPFIPQIFSAPAPRDQALSAKLKRDFFCSTSGGHRRGEELLTLKHEA